ncbi:hypothetical protein V8J88_19500 [Massilia sp. W12]|uniref:hypothetical protein n=1 Tax=Massilia sp. W12 TaxID=3126507 RepID=UPI0030CBDE6B
MELQAISNRATLQAISSSQAPAALSSEKNLSAAACGPGCACDACAPGAAALGSASEQVSLSSQGLALAAGQGVEKTQSAPPLAGFSSLLLPKAQQAALAYQS